MIIPIRDDIPSRRVPWVNYALILVNVAVFLFELGMPGRAQQAFVINWGAVPADFLGPGIHPDRPFPATFLTIYTSMFIHGGILHIAGNMLFLWIFGDNVEDRLGHARYLAYYLICGTAGALAHIFTNPGSGVPSVGASGAISGVLAAYFVLFPRASVVAFMLIFIFLQRVTLPARLFLLIWIVLQVFSGLGSLGVPAKGGTAYFAHIGGFGVGYLLIRRYRQQPQRYRYQEELWR